MPIYFHYRVVQQMVKDQPLDEQTMEFEKLHVKYAPRVLEAVLYLRGVYVKIGQVGVSREDVFPKVYRDAFKVLLDQVPPMPIEQIRQIVETALDKKIEEVFSEFDDKALGAASIGQVHRARLRDDGQECIVKVKYPNAYNLFQTDLTTMKMFVRLAQPEQALALDELERQLLKEFDFDNEGRALQRVKQSIEPRFPNVTIPKPFFYNRDIVIMQYLDGVKLVDAVVDEYERMAKSMGMTLDELIELGKKQPKPTRQDQLIQSSVYNLRRAFNLLGDTVRFAYNWTAGWFLPNYGYESTKPPPVNGPALWKTLLEVHGYELFHDGFFNGDPHPGNILLLKNGKIGLIDYGQVKSLEPLNKYQLARMFIAIQQKDSEEVVRQMHALGYESEKNDHQTAYELASIVFDKDDIEATKGLGFQLYMEELDRRDRAKKIPQDYVMVVRLCLILRGVGGMLKQPSPSLVNEWKHLAEQCIIDYESKYGRPVY